MDAELLEVRIAAPASDFTFSGGMGKGFMKTRRLQKRMEAEARNERTLPERRAKWHRGVLS